MEYCVGDKVQVYIPQANDPDHQYHGEIGEIVDILDDNLSDITGNPSRGHIYTVNFDNPNLNSADFRYSDLEKVQLSK